MADLAVWQRTIVDEKGDIIPGAEVSVRSYPGGSLITLYEGPDGVQVKGNPFSTGADGFARFWAESQRAEIIAHGAGSTIRWIVDLLNADEVIGDAISEATAAAADAVSEAEAAADRAEAARDAAQLNAHIYPTTAAGLAATTDGDYFSVPSEDSDEYLILYRNVGGSAEEVSRAPSARAVDGAVDLASQPALVPAEFNSGQRIAFAFVDEAGNTVAAFDDEGRWLEREHAEFHSDDALDVAFALTDEDGRLLLGFDAEGRLIANGFGSNGEVLSGSSAQLPYLDGSTLRAVGADDVVAAELGSYTALAMAPGNQKSVRAVLDWPAIGPTRSVSAGNGLLVPDSDKVLHIVIGLGQSLMVGSGARSSLVSTTAVYPKDVLMFDAGPDSDVRMALDASAGPQPVLDPADLVGFLPLVAKGGVGSNSLGETPMEAFANALEREARKLGIRYRMLCFAAAQGGSIYDDLKKGSQIYDNMLAATERAKQLAEEEGWRVIVDGCVVRHGESDASNAGYYDALLEWQGDVDADLRAITGQQAPVHFVLAQPSSFFGDDTQASPAIARAHADSPFHHLAGPDYGYSDLYFSDLLHGTGPFYYLSGEYLARAWAQALWSSGSASRITRIIGATRAGNAVTLTYEVPAPPLVFDVSTVSERDTKGFRYRDDQGEVSVTDAVIVDDGTSTGEGVIELTLGATPSGTGEQLLYALSGHDPAGRDADTIPRGNVRDSAPEVSGYDGRRLYNWAVHQRVDVE